MGDEVIALDEGAFSGDLHLPVNFVQDSDTPRTSFTQSSGYLFPNELVGRQASQHIRSAV